MNKSEQMPQQELGQAEKIAELEKYTEELKTRLKEAITDSVTGLERRAGLFEDINHTILEIISPEGLDKLEKLKGAQLVKFIEQLAQDEKIKKQPLNLAMCDVAYLSLANKSGLIGGDKLLAGIGDAARAIGSPEIKLKEDMTKEEKKPLIKLFRHGGDEITAIVREWPVEAEQKLAQFSQQVKKIKGIKDFEDNGLQPHIDYGLAHISEALKAFKKIMETKQGQEDIPPTARLKALENIWLEIAEMRATIKKTKIRLTLLAQLKTKQPKLYDNVIAYLRKGAHNISDANLTKLIEIAGKNFSGPQWEETTSAFIIQELKYENTLNLKSQIILDTILESN